MKAPSSLVCASVFIALASSLATLEAHPMHAAIEPHYHRYLQEKDSIQAELDDWLNEFKDQAEENGWIPVSEARSADDTEEDQRQRFFMTKENIKKLQEQNPNAQFSTNSPFTLMTEEEFNAYVGNAYRRGDEERRRLRHSQDNSWWDENSASMQAPTYSERSNSNSRTVVINRPSNGKAPAPSKSGSRSSNNVGYEFDFSSFFTWRPTPVPATKAPTRAPVVAPTDTPSTTAPKTRTPATQAPVKTRAPAATTASPSRGPVAPVDPVVAPENPATGPSSGAATPVAADGDSLDWSTSPCVAPPQNQGQCGSCWAFASVAAVEAAQCLAGDKKTMTKYSEQQLTSCDKRNLGCNGGAPTYAFQYIQQNGLCTEQAYPYASSNGGNAACLSSCAKTQTGIKGSARVSGEAGLVSTLATHPVVIAVAAGNNAWKQYVGGVLSSCQTSQVDHAVLAVGYDASSIKIKNSWGTRWGENGYIRMRRGGAGAGTCSMYTDMSHPTF
uniref:Peptidase C1A papain C-terminal domain-containing protein n=1 Tax=Globisporangium ultimum (strain ATCC 200006 / CBS 805.95 / DAOM BR144) TaxID=431595 RepID=K3XA16_GLOUD